MSALNHNIVDSQYYHQNDHQLCYVQCGYCDTILLVTVPSSRLAPFVTVRCGHCTTILGVHMVVKAAAPVLPLHLPASLNQDDESLCSKETKMAVELNSTEDLYQEAVKDANQQTTSSRMHSPSPVTSSFVKEENEDIINPKPCTKRPRTPSPYNCFIRDEIHRLKKENPNLTHKQAFSTAAKNK